MRPKDTTDLACGEHRLPVRLPVEWHDCSWQPAIQQPESRSENSEMQFNIGLKPALTPALSPRRGRNGSRCSQEPRVRMAENGAKAKSNCESNGQSNTFNNIQTGPEAVNPRPAGLNIGFIKPLPMPALLPHPARRKSLFKLMKKNPTGPRRFEAGFTLVELLVVIAIVAILAALLLPALTAAKLSAYKTQAKIQVNDIATAIQAYDSAYGRFPVTPQAQTLAGTNDLTYGGTYINADGVTWPNAAQMVQMGSTFVTANSNADVIAVLMDYTNYPDPLITGSTVNANYQLNPQKTAFLNAKLSGWDPNQPGLPAPGVGNDLVYRDPWGNPYIISMDLNYDGQCVDAFYGLSAVSQNGQQGLVNPTGNPNSNNYQFHGTVMVWSMGPYGPGTPRASSFDPMQSAKAGINKNHILSWQ